MSRDLVGDRYYCCLASRVLVLDLVSQDVVDTYRLTVNYSCACLIVDCLFWLV